MLAWVVYGTSAGTSDAGADVLSIGACDERRRRRRLRRLSRGWKISRNERRGSDGSIGAAMEREGGVLMLPGSELEHQQELSDAGADGIESRAALMSVGGAARRWPGPRRGISRTSDVGSRCIDSCRDGARRRAGRRLPGSGTGVSRISDVGANASIVPRWTARACGVMLAWVGTGHQEDQRRLGFIEVFMSSAPLNLALSVAPDRVIFFRTEKDFYGVAASLCPTAPLLCDQRGADGEQWGQGCDRCQTARRSATNGPIDPGSPFLVHT